MCEGCYFVYIQGKLCRSLRVRDLLVPLGNVQKLRLLEPLLLSYCCSGGGVQTLNFAAAAAKFISAAELVCLGEVWMGRMLWTGSELGLSVQQCTRARSCGSWVTHFQTAAAPRAAKTLTRTPSSAAMAVCRWPVAR